MTKYRKRPVVIEASQWLSLGDHPEVLPHLTKADFDCDKCGHLMSTHGAIKTLEDGFDGAHIVCSGDWVIKGVQGEHYACKPDVFELTYEKLPNLHYGTGGNVI